MQIQSLGRWTCLIGATLALAAFPMVPGLDAKITESIGISFGEKFPLIFIYAILALGLNVVVGNTGLLHLGIAAFFGFGSYVTAILMVEQYPFQVNFWLALLCAIIVPGLIAVAVSAPIMRLRGDYFALVTLGFGFICVTVMRNMEQITNGMQALGPIGSPPLPDFIANFIESIGIDSDWQKDYRTYYYLNFGFLILVYLLLRNLEASQLGRAWIAIREDELAAGCMGLEPAKLKLIAIGIAGGIAGLAGSLNTAKLLGTLEPTKYDFQMSATVLCALILGGLGNRAGVIFGVILIFSYEYILAPAIDFRIQTMETTGFIKKIKFANWNLLIFGLALILMMKLRPQGIFPARRLLRAPKAEPGKGA